MKTAKISLDWISQAKNNNTIDLAKIMWVHAMKPIQKTIKIKIAKIITGNEWIHEIPVKIKCEVSEILCFENLEDLISNKIATKKEFRLWNKIQKYFSL